MTTKQIIVVEYPKCSTCKAAIKSLKEKGFEVERRDITTNTPTTAELTKWIALSGLELKKWFNTAGEVYRQLGLKDKLTAMTDEEKIDLLSQHGMLIKRPIAISEELVTIGYKEEMYVDVWGNKE